jgi:hypothetical protein
MPVQNNRKQNTFSSSYALGRLWVTAFICKKAHDYLLAALFGDPDCLIVLCARQRPSPVSQALQSFLSFACPPKLQRRREPRALPYALCDFDVQIGGLSLKSASFFQKWFIRSSHSLGATPNHLVFRKLKDKDLAPTPATSRSYGIFCVSTISNRTPPMWPEFM